MCDTVVAIRNCTVNHITLFGKNSDRQRNEAHVVERTPAAVHSAGAVVDCTYISIPQARRTHAVVLCRPFWMWGAEIGANEHGVVIGNEGLYARIPSPQANALTGMDLLRLALERASCAREAAEQIGKLLETYGQGGNCGYLTPSYYHNSFLIVDGDEALVMETVGHEWLVRRAGSIDAISNDYTIGTDSLCVSRGLDEALQTPKGEGCIPNYAQLITDESKQHIGAARERRERALSVLHADEGRLSVLHIMRLLRDHDPTGRQKNDWDPSLSTKYSLCIHAGPENKDCQTTGAMASEIRRRDAVHWVTGTAAPCLSLFKPVLVDVPLPAHGPSPTGKFDPAGLWWRHEVLHRRALMEGFASFLREIGEERDGLEAEFHARVSAVLDGGASSDRAAVIAQCWADAIRLEQRWISRLSGVAHLQQSPFRAAWRQMNELAGITTECGKGGV